MAPGVDKLLGGGISLTKAWGPTTFDDPTKAELLKGCLKMDDLSGGLATLASIAAVRELRSCSCVVMAGKA